MEQRKKVLTLAFLFAALATVAQPITENRTGNLRAQGNIAGGYLFAQKNFRSYLTGDIDLFVDDNVSITGSVWYNFKDNDAFGLLRNHSVFGGMNYHPVKKGRWDPFIGISPGVAIVTAGSYNVNDVTNAPTTGAAPLISGEIGCNYYVGSIFNLFVKVRGVAGHFNNSAEFQKLHELKLTAGLGWNFRLWKAN